MLRIIGGSLKRRKIRSVEGWATRPTSDRVRESIFNILFDRTKGSHVLDLFAGTGAMGIEALSRGASSATFIDNEKTALLTIKKNIESLTLFSQAVVIAWDIRRNLQCLNHLSDHFDLVFMDPPYHSDLILPTLNHLQKGALLKSEAMIVIEHAAEESVPSDMPGYRSVDERRYGKTGISILEFLSDIHRGV
jgi:16S rRNA (guanine966-N2)-methyltransferase